MTPIASYDSITRNFRASLYMNQELKHAVFSLQRSRWQLGRTFHTLVSRKSFTTRNPPIQYTALMAAGILP